MVRSLLLILAALVSAVPSAASDIGNVKCPANQDRVWVYESLASFDVEAKLHCGETVEIVSRVKGYVKVRTANGIEGYVPDSAFPNLPPLEDDKDKPAVANVARPVPSSSASTPVAAVQPAPVPAAAQATAVVSAPAPAAIPSAPTPAAPTATPPPAPAAAPAVQAVSASEAVTTNSSASAPKVSVRAKQKLPATTTPKKKVAPPTATPAAQPIPSTVQTAVAAPAPAIVTAKASASPVTVTLVDSGAAIPPSRTIRTAQAAADLDDSDEYPNAAIENESADPACQTYFSAYGLAPSQFEWMASSRRKEFAGICPAPNPASVDYVILFTHDSDSYAAAMPEPVHVDRSGFSDFNPLTTVDTALISRTQAEKARYEFVWVFRVKRGAFDPARFSPRRRPTYSTTESKGSRSSQIIEDAFRYMQGQQGYSR